MEAITALDDVEIRRVVNDFSIAKPEGPFREWIAKLAGTWHALNDAHFAGAMSPAFLFVLEPRSPRALGDCSLYAGHGGKLQIRIRPSHVDGTVNRDKKPAPGKTVRYMREDHDLLYRERHLNDILLREMVHQWQMEVLGTTGDHGKDFCSQCNAIGERLGLAPVVIRRRKGDPHDLAICAEWPHNVRPDGYYGDLWATRSAAADEGDDEVLRLVASFAALSEADQQRFLAHPVVVAALPTPTPTVTASSGTKRTKRPKARKKKSRTSARARLPRTGES